MADLGSGLAPRTGGSRRSACRIGSLARSLVLRVPPHSQKEFSPLDLELVLREIPGESVERPGRSRQRQRLAHRLSRAPLLDSPRSVVLRVPCPPRRLRRCPPRRLALLARARPLPGSHPRVRREPPQALPTRALLGRHGGHRRLPSLASTSLRSPPRLLHRASGRSLLVSKPGSILASAEAGTSVMSSAAIRSGRALAGSAAHRIQS